MTDPDRRWDNWTDAMVIELLEWDAGSVEIENPALAEHLREAARRLGRADARANG